VGTSNLIAGEAARTITGRDGTFTVRPEKIRLVEPEEQAGAGQCTATGVVSDVAYLGSQTRFVVRLDVGGELVVTRQNLDTSSMEALAAMGRRVRLVWDRQHNLLLAE
jgi:putative spermidine/putrescine transport system ATP-binding protein